MRAEQRLATELPAEIDRVIEKINLPENHRSGVRKQAWHKQVEALQCKKQKRVHLR
jgi:hypothetical protein